MEADIIKNYGFRQKDWKNLIGILLGKYVLSVSFQTTNLQFGESKKGGTITMKSLEQYVSAVRAKLPDIEERLNGGAAESALQQLAAAAACELPAEFTALYSRFDGENLTEHTGFLAGLTFLPLERVLSELSFFKKAEIEMTAMGTKAIREEPVCGLTWIPFAFDGSRAYLFMDMSPTGAGKAGQIIAVDYDRDCCYLLADSLDALFEKMASWLTGGVLTIHTEGDGKPFLTEETGHLFNSLDRLTAPAESGDAAEISLPAGFWQERYKKACVPVSRFAKERSLFLKGKVIDCVPFQYMENLKELILHDCTLGNIEYIAKAPQLKKLFLANCTFGEKNLSVLAEAPQLKELSLNVMRAEGLSTLQKVKTLKSLSVRKVTGIALEELAGFEGLQELSVEDMELHDGTVIAGLKNLKKLDLHRHTMDNLDFLQGLKKLTEFYLAVPARNEEGLSAVCGLTKLKVFVYPVRDLQIYANHPSLESVGMAADTEQSFAVFAGSKVNSFTVCGNIPKEKLDHMAEEMEQYVKLSSYGSRGGDR